MWCKGFYSTGVHIRFWNVYHHYNFAYYGDFVSTMGTLIHWCLCGNSFTNRSLESIAYINLHEFCAQQGNITFITPMKSVGEKMWLESKREVQSWKWQLSVPLYCNKIVHPLILFSLNDLFIEQLKKYSILRFILCKMLNNIMFHPSL